MPGAPCLPRASFPAPGGEAAPAHAAPARPAPPPPQPCPSGGGKREAGRSQSRRRPLRRLAGPTAGAGFVGSGPEQPHRPPRSGPTPRLALRCYRLASLALGQGPGPSLCTGLPSDAAGPAHSADKLRAHGPPALSGQVGKPRPGSAAVWAGPVGPGAGWGRVREQATGPWPFPAPTQGFPSSFLRKPWSPGWAHSGDPRPSPQTSSDRLPGPGKIQMWGGLGNTRSLRPPPPRPRPSQGSFSSAPLELGCLTKGGLLDPEETPLERDDPAEPLGMAQESSVRGSGRAPAPLPQPHLPAPHKPPSRSQASQGNFYSSPGGREASAPQHPRLVPPPLSPVQPPAPYRRLPGPLLQADWRWEAERPSGPPHTMARPLCPPPPPGRPRARQWPAPCPQS